MACVLTVTLVGGGMFVLLAGRGDLDLQRMAGSSVGAAIGYWFR